MTLVCNVDKSYHYYSKIDNNSKTCEGKEINAVEDRKEKKFSGYTVLPLISKLK